MPTSKGMINRLMGKKAFEEPKTPKRPPRGYIDIYVGEEQKRYVVPCKYYLHSPDFYALIRPITNDMIDLPLQADCTCEEFERALRNLKRSHRKGFLRFLGKIFGQRVLPVQRSQAEGF
ncbi:hypothetical protein Sjap_014293 [Stephania japonica]|uniref:Uncharacterized protein n=1 Tax=Stephania japonica TaxID=461633 RepID=A0AAP0P247_9MAGN